MFERQKPDVGSPSDFSSKRSLTFDGRGVTTSYSISGTSWSGRRSSGASFRSSACWVFTSGSFGAST